jgi:hypothetical protein
LRKDNAHFIRCDLSVALPQLELHLAARRTAASVGTMLAILNAVVLAGMLLTLTLLKIATRALRQQAGGAGPNNS